MLRTCSVIGTCLMLIACANEAAKHAEGKKNIAAEIARICALPEAQRAEALAKLRKDTGYELQCAPP